MKAFFDPGQTAHDPQTFLANGVLRPSPEQPRRAEVLHEAAVAAGCEFSVPEDHGIAFISDVHPSEYLAFLQNIHARWQRMDGASEEVVPNVHPNRHGVSYPDGMVGQAGWHMADTACPIGPHTWASAYLSAQSAVSGAQAVLSGEQAVYALCRPPGHHAFSDMAGGFCFLNNAAIAAKALLRAGCRPAILDVDVHHGNGTQGIFYDDPEVLTVSVHADPARFYPFFWGHAHERGRGPGEGTNLNLPLDRGTGDDGFLAALENGLERIELFGCDALVVALGLDAHENDPFQGLAVTTSGFASIAARIASLDLPTVIVQEGGYLQPELGPNLRSFLEGWQG
ncbi:histone deacetylase family protein [Thalassococcus profundi]|uniref:Histone deacetylase family protein n=1 Tax=Thalassococcus profundi TaxID=2282382 RepID=A0A369TNT3_9RHOB|nr:histone deacetylase family protein [Thalassococcus profundi]RDD66951.1 histone deacetylase family protein [Thalassococcus profundi]